LVTLPTLNGRIERFEFISQKHCYVCAGISPNTPQATPLTVQGLTTYLQHNDIKDSSILDFLYSEDRKDRYEELIENMDNMNVPVYILYIEDKENNKPLNAVIATSEIDCIC
jgi:hypothetical protein